MANPTEQSDTTELFTIRPGNSQVPDSLIPGADVPYFLAGVDGEPGKATSGVEFVARASVLGFLVANAGGVKSGAVSASGEFEDRMQPPFSQWELPGVEEHPGEYFRQAFVEGYTLGQQMRARE